MRLFWSLMVLWSGIVQAQVCTVTGYFPQLGEREVALVGFSGLREQALGRARCDATGRFELNYPASYTGSALLTYGKQKEEAFVLLLNGENFGVHCEDLKNSSSLRFSQSPENDALTKGMKLYQTTENRRGGLLYLLPLYADEFDKQRWIQDALQAEQNRFDSFVRDLQSGSYAAFYLQARAILSRMSQAVSRKPELVPAAERAFQTIDFNDPKWWSSGLLGNLFSAYYQLVSKYEDKDSVYVHAVAGTNKWIKGFQYNSSCLNDVADYCFKMLEKHNVTNVSEYIALSMLSDTGCSLDEKEASLFEQYRKLAIGKTAPDITLSDGKLLSGLTGRYKLLVFGASWCPDCQRDYPTLVGQYKQLRKKYDVEFVYVSLDSTKEAARTFYKEAPFRVSCEGRGWHSDAVREYCIVATPTYFLLDEKLKIVAKLNYPEQLEAILKQQFSLK